MSIVATVVRAERVPYYLQGKEGRRKPERLNPVWCAMTGSPDVAPRLISLRIKKGHIENDVPCVDRETNYLAGLQRDVRALIFALNQKGNSFAGVLGQCK